MQARKILEGRRMAEIEKRAIQLQIELCGDDGGPVGIKQSKAPEKIPGKDEFVSVAIQTNNVQAMKSQHYDGYKERLATLEMECREIIDAAEDVIAFCDDRQTRAILRYYYCIGWTDAQIAREIGGSVREVNRIRNKVVSWLDNNYIAEHGEIIC